MKKIIILTSLLMAGTLAQAQQYARVLSSSPIISQISTPQRICSGYQESYQSNSQGAILGAVIGGVIGNSISNNHKGASTVAGVLAGAALGNQINNSRNSSNCYNTYINQESIVGYNVWYEYRGDRYQTRTSYQPGSYITINEPVFIQQSPVYVHQRPIIIRDNNHDRNIRHPHRHNDRRFQESRGWR